MSKNFQIKKYLPAILVMAIAIASTILPSNVYNLKSLKEFFKIICDAFFVSGVILSGVAGLSFIGSMGTFDIFGYGFKSLLYLFTPSKKAFEERKSFYDYKEQKDKKRNGWLKEFLILGVICIALSIVFVILYSIV